jgi:hypothetical protein
VNSRGRPAQNQIRAGQHSISVACVGVRTRHTRTTCHSAHVHPGVLRPVKLGCDDIMIAVSVLALAAAFLFALSAFLQERAARTVVGDNTASLRDASGVRRLVGRLVRSRMWLRFASASRCTLDKVVLVQVP